MKTPTDKMKPETNNWSSMDQVLDSFNNVTLFGNRNEQDDIYRPPSPAIYRISPSQLEILGIDPEPERAPSPEPRPICRGRGRIIASRASNARDRDLALHNAIRATKGMTHSNSGIEAYFNQNCFSSSNSSDVSKKEEEDNKSLDQISIDSNLNADAFEFYPKNYVPDPSEISKRLTQIRDSKFPQKEEIKKYSPRKVYRVDESDCRIGFRGKIEDSESDDDKEADTSQSTELSTLSFSSRSKLKSPISEKISIDVKPSTSKTCEPKVTKTKRVYVNAALSGLKNQPKPPLLMKPVDFNVSSDFKPIDIPKCSKDEPYNYLTDPFMTDETRKLIKSLTSIPPTSSPTSSRCMSTTSYSSTSPVMSSQSDSTSSRPRSRAPKPRSYYEYSYKENDFPPLS